MCLLQLFNAHIVCICVHDIHEHLVSLCRPTVSNQQNVDVCMSLIACARHVCLRVHLCVCVCVCMRAKLKTYTQTKQIEEEIIKAYTLFSLPSFSVAVFNCIYGLCQQSTR